jgi:hypothetical protein
MELVAIHQYESQRATTLQDTTQFNHGQTSFTHSTLTNNTRTFTTDNDNNTLESDNDSNFGQPFENEEEATFDSTGPLLTISDNFASYVNVMMEDRGLSTDAECYDSKLMILLRKTKASMSMYKDVMEWHLRASGSLPPHASVGNCPFFQVCKENS